VIALSAAVAGATSGPDWAKIVTAVGTVLVAIVAVAVTLYAEQWADKRVAEA
jgi:hypothetical protein